MSTKSSRFVWHDLMTSDVDGAKRFYGELLGWTFFRGDKGPYEHIKAGEQHIGGIMKFEKPGMPPNWIGYIDVENIDATTSAIQKNGGKIVAPKTSIPDAGEFAVATDTQGAFFAPFRQSGKNASAPESNAKPAPYTFCWDELLSPDPVAAAKFYNAVFGWGSERMEMGEMGTYTLLKRPGVKDDTGREKDAGGIMPMPPTAQHPPFWLAYVAVPDADAAAAKVKRLGGQVMMGPMDIPNVGRFFPAMDPQHASIAFLAPPK